MKQMTKTLEERVAELEQVAGQGPKPERKPWPRFDPTAQMTLGPVALKAMTDAVPDALTRTIAREQARPVALPSVGFDTMSPTPREVPAARLHSYGEEARRWQR